MLKALAVLFLALAIGAVFGSVQATSRSHTMRGPSALLVTSGGDIWLGVDRELWRVTRDGSLRDTQAIDVTGLPGVPANLVHGPAGRVVASVRGDPTLYLMDAASARVVGRLSPQWPEDLRAHGARAIQFAFDAAGRVAISTGGGHAVALFDPQGSFLARTAAGAYEFTNGLWWSPEGLWTTDTNRFTLRLLDPDTLAERRAMPLGREPGGGFLGPARARPAADAAAGGPLAALMRFHDGMVEGGVALVDDKGRARSLPHGALMRPLDLDWLDDTLLVSDGESSSILRWSAQGRALAPFGDAALQARLSALADERHALQTQHTRWIVAAVTLLLLGLISALAAAGATRRRQPARPLDLSRLGTPRVGWRAMLRMTTRAQGAMLTFGLLALALQWMPRAWWAPLRCVSLGALWSVIAAFSVLAILAAWWQARRLRQLSREPAYEPMFNGHALRLLHAQARTLGTLLEPGETILETFLLQPGRAWWLLTDRRLLHLKPTLTDLRVAESVPLERIKAASTRRGTLVARGWSLFGGNEASWIEIALTDGRAIQGSTGAPPLAERLANRLGQSRVLPRGSAPRVPPSLPGPSAGRRWRRMLLSLLLPGSAHWLQGRAIEGTVLFGSWLGLLFFLSGPMLWTLIEPYTAVNRAAAQMAAFTHLILGLLAAIDAWRLEGARPG